jgi:hypothetical protein
MNTSHVFIPICYFCRQLINLGTPFFLVGDRDRVHAKCLEQWKNDDPLEWEGQPDPVRGA